MGSKLRDIFDEFDWLNRGFLTVVEIRRHFDCYPDETQSYRMGGNMDFNAEIELLIRRVNKDKLNGRISLTEWLDELSPAF
jgi:Ca2+-binding EF-hand superfamily protein